MALALLSRVCLLIKNTDFSARLDVHRDPMQPKG